MANGYHQVSSNYHFRLIVPKVISLMTGNRLQSDLGEPMASVTAIGIEVFGSCVGEIFVSVELKK